MSHLNDSHLGSQSIFLQSQNSAISIADAHKIFFLSEVISPPPDVKMLIALTSFECPYSYYNINSNINDEITFSTSNGSHTINVGSQNFSSTQLATKITSLLSLSSATTDLGATIICSFDDTSNKFTFLSNSLEFSITSTTMGKELGLKNNIPISSSGQKLSSVNICNLSGTSSIYIRLENISVKNLDSRGQFNNTIAKALVNCNPMEFIFFQQQESIYYLIQQNQITHLEIQLTDENNNTLILNGGEFSLTLTLHFRKSVEQYINPQFLLDKKLISQDNINEVSRAKTSQGTKSREQNE